jgi:hypothetical protein
VREWVSVYERERERERARAKPLGMPDAFTETGGLRGSFELMPVR